MCAIIEVAPKPTFPRPCPCANAVCQQEWHEDTKDEKQDWDLQQHCSTCHVNVYSKLGTHCETCQKFVCMSCKQTQTISPASEPIIYDGEEDANVDLCNACKLEWLRIMALKAKQELQDSETHNIVVCAALQDLEKATATATLLHMTKK